MLAFALLLIAGGLITVVTIFLFVFDFVAPLLCAVAAAQLALQTGGGWPGGMALGALAFAVTSTVLRLGAAVARPLIVRMVCAALIVVPAAGLAFGLMKAILWNLVPSDPWRTGLAIISAVWIATNTYRRHMLSHTTCLAHQGSVRGR